MATTAWGVGGWGEVARACATTSGGVGCASQRNRGGVLGTCQPAERVSYATRFRPCVCGVCVWGRGADPGPSSRRVSTWLADRAHIRLMPTRAVSRARAEHRPAPAGPVLPNEATARPHARSPAQPGSCGPAVVRDEAAARPPVRSRAVQLRPSSSSSASAGSSTCPSATRCRGKHRT